MGKKENPSLFGVSNKAFGLNVAALLRDAAAVQAAGLLLPEFKPVKNKKSEDRAPHMLSVTNAAFEAHVRGVFNVTKTAMDLRQSKNKGPTFEV